MRLIKEELFHNRSVFYAIDTDKDGVELSRVRYDCRTFEYEYQGKRMIFIGDRNEQIRAVPFYYVNYKRRGLPFTTRMQMACAVQLYYIFCDIGAYDPENLTPEGYSAFKEFLRGVSVLPMPGATVTHRSMETVKSYIGMLRAFLWENRFDMSSWGEERGSDRRDGSARARSRYVDSDLRGNSVGRNVAPTHMKVPQVAEVAAAMMRRHDEMMLCIFQIGITTGMRRGEILGLTIQDVKAVPLNTKTNGVSDVRYFIVIRNRISDDDDRGSKTLRHPANSEQENASAFKRSRFEVDINEDLYNRIMAYYRRTRDPRLAGGLEEVERIRRATRATGDNGLGGNYYIFFHKWRGEYRLLSGQTVNNRLKSFFKEVGVITKNVSHCLRHTYAMHLAKYSKNRVGEKEVQTALRHASPTSTKSYFNMTEEEIQDMDRAFAAEFTSLVPAFKMPMGRTAAKANTEDGPTE